MNTDTRKERQQVRAKLDEIAKKKIQEDFDVALKDLETFNPSDKKADTTARGILFDAHQLLDQLDHLDRDLPVLESAPTCEETDAYEPEFLIDNWMPANRLTILTGTGGIGKSYLALQHIAGLALGITDYFLKQYHDTTEELYSENSHAFRKAPIKVVIASYEEDLLETWKRLDRICDRLGWADRRALRENISFVDLKMFGPIWGVGQDTHMAIRAKLLEVGDWLLNECKDFDARLLMLDPSAGVYGASEIARESVREFCSYLNGWGQDPEVECATLLIAHPNKTGDDYSGSTDWLGSCRAMWTLQLEERSEGTSKEKKTFKTYQLTNVKQNYAAPERTVYLRKIKVQHGWTPIWERCTQREAEAFCKAYHQDNSLSISDPTKNEEETATNDENEIDTTRFEV